MINQDRDVMALMQILAHTSDDNTLGASEASFGESDPQRLKLVAGGKLVKLKVAELLNGVEETPPRPRDMAREAGVALREAVRLVFSYSHKDEELRDQLETHLKLLQRQDVISTWHDRKIQPGEEWEDVIDENFKRADLILLLV